MKDDIYAREEQTRKKIPSPVHENCCPRRSWKEEFPKRKKSASFKNFVQEESVEGIIPHSEDNPERS